MEELELKDVARVIRAICTAQLARVAPKFYLRLTRQTGRGGGDETPAEVAAYFRRCFEDYLRVVGVPANEAPTWLRGGRGGGGGGGGGPGGAGRGRARGAE